MTVPRTAAALMIGNELLSGKIRDENVGVLAAALYERGIALRRVRFCPDEIDAIVTDLDALRTEHDWVFTSGGVGPTHDDVTIDALCRAFARPRVRAEPLAALLQAHFGARLTERHLLMADMPAGASLVAGTGRGRWPTIQIDNVFVLPGVPIIFQRKLEALMPLLGAHAPFVSRALATDADEGTVAPILDRIGTDHPALRIGSYPHWDDDGRYALTLTVDGRDAARVDAAVHALRDALIAADLRATLAEGLP